MYKLSTITILRILYFLLGFIGSTSSYSLKRDLNRYNVDISSINIYIFWIYFIWQIKFVPANLVDRFRIPGYHRKPYIIVGNGLAAIFAFCLTIPTLDLQSYFAFWLMAQIMIVFADVNYDALVIEEGKKEEDKNRGKLQISAWKLRAAGSAIGDFLGPILRKAGGSTLIFALVGTFLLLGMGAGIVMNETVKIGPITHVSFGVPVHEDGVGIDTRPRRSREEKIKKYTFWLQCSMICKVLQNPVLLLILLFVFVSVIIPSPGLAFFYYEIEVLKFDDYEFSILGGVSAVAKLFVVFLFEKMRDFNLREIYVTITFARICTQLIPLGVVYILPISEAKHLYQNATLLYDSQFVTIAEANGIPNLAMCLSEEIIGEALDDLLYMPFQNVAQIICLHNVEASAYETIISILNFAGQLRRFFDSAVLIIFGINNHNFQNLVLLFWFCFAIDIITLPLTFLIPNTNCEEVSKNVREEEEIEMLDDVLKNTLTMNENNKSYIQNANL